MSVEWLYRLWELAASIYTNRDGEGLGLNSAWIQVGSAKRDRAKQLNTSRFWNRFCLNRKEEFWLVGAWTVVLVFSGEDERRDQAQLASTKRKCKRVERLVVVIQARCLRAEMDGSSDEEELWYEGERERSCLQSMVVARHGQCLRIQQQPSQRNKVDGFGKARSLIFY